MTPQNPILIGNSLLNHRLRIILARNTRIPANPPLRQCRSRQRAAAPVCTETDQTRPTVQLDAARRPVGARKSTWLFASIWAERVKPRSLRAHSRKVNPTCKTRTNLHDFSCIYVPSPLSWYASVPRPQCAPQHPQPVHAPGAASTHRDFCDEARSTAIVLAHPACATSGKPRLVTRLLSPFCDRYPRSAESEIA